MATIHAATGPIDTADLGFTLMHEHVRVGWPPMYQQYPEMCDRAARNSTAPYPTLKAAQEAGVRSDGRPHAHRPRPRRRASSPTPRAHRAMQIIVATGIYYTPYPFHFRRPPRLAR